MKLRRIIARQVDHERDGFTVRAAFNAVIAANVNEPSGDATATSEQHIVQRSQATATTPGHKQEATDE